MTNIGHFRAVAKLLAQQKGPLPTRLWVAPPTKMDAEQLKAEGYFGMFGDASARMEMPGCSMCMVPTHPLAHYYYILYVRCKSFKKRGCYYRFNNLPCPKGDWLGLVSEKQQTR